VVYAYSWISLNQTHYSENTECNTPKSLWNTRGGSQAQDQAGQQGTKQVKSLMVLIDDGNGY